MHARVYVCMFVCMCVGKYIFRFRVSLSRTRLSLSLSLSLCLSLSLYLNVYLGPGGVSQSGAVDLHPDQLRTTLLARVSDSVGTCAVRVVGDEAGIAGCEHQRACHCIDPRGGILPAMWDKRAIY